MKFTEIFLMVFFSFLHSITCLSLKMQTNMLTGLVPEANMSIEQLIVTKGYKLQVHFTQTEDGYILKLFRILPKINLINTKAILLQHGLFVCINNLGLE